MDTYLSNCSTVALTNSFLIRILGSLGAVSVATCLVALCWLFYLKLHKQFIYRLAAYQVMASLLNELFTVCQFTFLEYNDSKYMYSLCVTVSYLVQIAVWMKTFFSCWIIFHLFFFAVLLKNMRRLEPLYVITSILVPIAISSVPLITKSYGPTGEWCWIQRKKCGENYVVGDIEQIAVWYGPAFVLLVLQCVAMLIMNNIAFKQLLPLVAYPVLFCILIIPPLIARVYGFVSSTPPSQGLVILLAICVPAWSLSAGVTLIVHIGGLKCTEIMRMLFSISRAKDTSTITVSQTQKSYQRSNSRLLGRNTRSSTYFSLPIDT